MAFQSCSLWVAHMKAICIEEWIYLQIKDLSRILAYLEESSIYCNFPHVLLTYEL